MYHVLTHILAYFTLRRFQCLLTCIICIVLGHFGEITRNNGSKSILDDFPVVKFEGEKLVKMLPLSLIFVGMITFNNLCLQYVEVSFCKYSPLCCIYNVLLSYYTHKPL